MADKCKCLEICGHLEAVKWLIWPRKYKPSPGMLAVGDWRENPFIWLHYVMSADELLEDDVLRSTDTRYWSIHDVQRYLIGDLHCETVLFTYQYPNLKMPTHLGSYFWKANNALKILPKLYLKEYHMSLQLSLQDNLQLVSLENLCCTRPEGVSVLQHLACFNSHSLKYLFLWRFVLPNENPTLINYSYITGSGEYINRPDTKVCFLRCLAELRNLRVLALEYSHLADGTGNSLLSLLPVLKRPHFRLQLICREDQIPGKVDAALGVGGYEIPDTAWRRILISCPDLYLFMVFFRIHDYDNLRRFLTPSLPLHEAHLQLGIDLYKGRQESDLSTFIRHIAYRYSNTLSTLSIHHWRTAELPLHRVFELMPFLTRFLYVGCINEKQLREALKLVACGVCEKLKQISIQIQDTKSRESHWKNVAVKLNEDYQDIMKLYNINLCLAIYKH